MATQRSATGLTGAEWDRIQPLLPAQHNIPPEVWAFTIGGYPVIKKWLDYRHVDKLGRPLRLEEALYVREMVQRIAALLALGPALDASYAAVKADSAPLDLSRLGKPSLVAVAVDEGE